MLYNIAVKHKNRENIWESITLVYILMQFMLKTPLNQQGNERYLDKHLFICNKSTYN